MKNNPEEIIDIDPAGEYEKEDYPISGDDDHGR